MGHASFGQSVFCSSCDCQWIVSGRGALAVQKIFIAIAGNIGTGKTTLTHMLSKRFGWTPHFEAVVDNPYLADFYKDMARWSFPLQIFFLNNRFRAHQEITQRTESARSRTAASMKMRIFSRATSTKPGRWRSATSATISSSTR